MAGPSGTTARLALPYPIPDDNVDVPRDVKALAEKIDPLGIVPVGALLMWPTAVAPPDWLLCNGQQVSAAQYPGLATVLGQTAGQVTLPNLTGRVPLGASGSRPLGSTGGEETHLLTQAEMPQHSHPESATNLVATVDPGTTVNVGAPVASNTGNAGSGAAHNNMPPYLAVNIIIRAG